MFNSSASAPEVTWEAKGTGSAAFVTSAQFLMKPLEHELSVKSEIPVFSCSTCVAEHRQQPRARLSLGTFSEVFSSNTSPCPRVLQPAQGCRNVLGRRPCSLQTPAEQTGPARTGSQAVGRRAGGDRGTDSLSHPVPALREERAATSVCTRNCA